MGVFDEYRAFYFRHPRTMNFGMLYFSFALVLVFGKFPEKFTFNSSQTSYEFNRRARRLFIPYSLASYKFRFPQSQ